VVGQGLAGRVEDVAPAAQLGWDVDDGDQHGDVDHRVLDEGDQGRRPQAALIGVGGQDGEGDEQRQVALQGAGAAAADAHALQYDLDADQLQGDVGHGGQDAGRGHRQRQPAAAIAAAHEVRWGHVLVLVRHRPQPRHHQEHERVDDVGVGQREEPERAHTEHQRRHRDEGVGGVQVAAEQEPGDDRAEASAAQPPLVEVAQVGRTPAGGHEAEHGD
jgi:hypothetical protein